MNFLDASYNPIYQLVVIEHYSHSMEIEKK